MKVRNGFVSNSSSSSFLIYGISTNEEGIPINDLTEEALSVISSFDHIEEIREIGLVDNNNDEVDRICSELKISYWHWYECGFWFGKSWSAVKDDQTGKQFKEETTEQLKKLIKPESSLWKTLGTHKEAWNS